VTPYIDFDTQIKTLLRTVIVLGFLLALNGLTSGKSVAFTFQTPGSITHGRLLTPPARHLGTTSIVVHSALTSAEKRILAEHLGEYHELVECRATWPEYAGFGLAGCFGLSCFWFIFSVVGEEWTAQRARYVVRGKLTAFAALYFTYGTAAWLGWVWMRAWPFWAMGATILVFGALLQRIPLSIKPKREKLRTYLLVNHDGERH
jgi:hypothetical protein